MMDEEIKPLLVKYITGNADPNERQFVRQWLEESQDHVDYFTSLKAAWDDALYHPGERRVNTDDAFNRLRKRLTPDETAAKPAAEPVMEKRQRRLFSIPRVAAAVILLVIAGGVGAYLYKKSSPQPIAQTALALFVPNGKMKKIVLPDSTEVWLNAGTRFSYAADFGEHVREVSLDGEGYFAVKHMENIPFVVKAHGYMVRDIGTIFTVSAYPHDHFRTAVIEGEVEVSGRRIHAGQDGKVLLTRNEVLSIEESNPRQERSAGLPVHAPEADHTSLPETQPQAISAVEMDRYAGWKDHLLVFEEETFDEVAQRLQRTFDVKIRITSSQLAGFRYTGRFNKVQNISEALRIIRETTPIAYHTEKDTIIISMDKKGL